MCTGLWLRIATLHASHLGQCLPEHVGGNTLVCAAVGVEQVLVRPNPWEEGAQEEALQQLVPSRQAGDVRRQHLARRLHQQLEQPAREHVRLLTTHDALLHHAIGVLKRLQHMPESRPLHSAAVNGEGTAPLLSL